MRWLHIAGIASIGLSFSFAQAQNNPPRNFVPGELIIGYKSAQDRDDAARERPATQEKMEIRGQKPENIEIKKVGETAVQVRIVFPKSMQESARPGSQSELALLEAAAKQIKEKDPRVKYAHPNWIMGINPPRGGDANDPRVELQSFGGTAPEQAAPAGAPNDPFYNLQWHYQPLPKGMNAVGAWRATKGSRDIVVAVLDTGIVDEHEDLGGPKGNLLPGYNFVTYNMCTGERVQVSPGATDYGDSCTPGAQSSWHGTHVAGTIGAVTSNNGKGLAGVAWNVRILPVRVLGPGGGSTTDIAAAMRWAAGLPVEDVPANKYPADIINMSLGGVLRTSQGMFECTEETAGLYIDAINEVRRAGTVIVTAAGNGEYVDANNQSCNPGQDNPLCRHQQANFKNFAPAGCPGVISVAAADANGHLAWYSNFGAVTIMAPGGDTGQTAEFVVNGQKKQMALGVWSSVKSNYRALNGTSQAAPHVAGAIALAMSAHPEWRKQPDLIEQKLRGAAVTPPAGACPAEKPCGPGQLDAAILLETQAAAKQ